MKNKIIILGIVAFVCSGCEAITLEQVQGLATQVESLNQVLDQYQAQNMQLLQQMAEQGTVKPEAVEQAQKINDETDKVQAQIAAIATAIKSVQPSGDQVQDLLAAAKAANTASAAWNPFAVYIDIGLALAAAVAGVLWRKKAAVAAEAQAKYTAHKQGVEAATKELAAIPATGVTAEAVASLIYNKIGEKRADLGIV